MRFDEAVVRLETALGRRLPGSAAQSHMAPRPRGGGRFDFDPRRTRHAAGLLLLFPQDTRAQIVLTVRTATVRHGGQVSLPGGVVDPGETFERAALREAYEEIGLLEKGVRILGGLTPVDIPASGFKLHPIVATVDERPLFSLSNLEVASVLEVSVSTLMDPGTLRRKTLLRDGMSIDVPAFEVDGIEVWGATAMVLSEFLVLLGWTAPAFN